MEKTEAAPVLEVSHLTKKYGNFLALDDVSFEIPRGKIIGFLGPNGSGKTTCIKIVAGLLTASSGIVRVNGIPVGEATKAHVAYLP